MEIFMKVNGQTTEQMAMDYTNMLMGLSMKETGKMIYSMATVLKHGMTVLGMKECMLLEENMELGLINGMMDHNILENGMKIKYVALAYILG